MEEYEIEKRLFAIFDEFFESTGEHDLAVQEIVELIREIKNDGD